MSDIPYLCMFSCCLCVTSMHVLYDLFAYCPCHLSLENGAGCTVYFYCLLLFQNVSMKLFSNKVNAFYNFCFVRFVVCVRQVKFQHTHNYRSYCSDASYVLDNKAKMNVLSIRIRISLYIKILKSKDLKKYSFYKKQLWYSSGPSL